MRRSSISPAPSRHRSSTATAQASAVRGGSSPASRATTSRFASADGTAVCQSQVDGIRDAAGAARAAAERRPHRGSATAAAPLLHGLERGRRSLPRPCLGGTPDRRDADRRDAARRRRRDPRPAAPDHAPGDRRRADRARRTRALGRPPRSQAADGDRGDGGRDRRGRPLAPRRAGRTEHGGRPARHRAEHDARPDRVVVPRAGGVRAAGCAASSPTPRTS